MIQVHNLSYTYAGGTRPAVNGLTFDVQPGEIFGFLGPSGAGKSTTQKVLIGLLRNYQGQVTVLGKDLRAWGPDYYERIGVSFEVPNLYLKLTGLENLRYFASLYSVPTEDPRSLLAAVDLAEDADTPVGQYSKGMKVRLNFARSLLHRPTLLFLDEPTAGLDPVNARKVKAIIRSQRDAGRTVFLTTHDMTVADDLCDRVAFIVDGQIALIDVPKALKLRFGRPRVRVEYGVDGRLEAAEFPLEGLADNAGFLDLLRRNRVHTIHSQEATLEDVFVQVTGRALS